MNTTEPRTDDENRAQRPTRDVRSQPCCNPGHEGALGEPGQGPRRDRPRPIDADLDALMPAYRRLLGR